MAVILTPLMALVFLILIFNPISEMQRDIWNLRQ
jgi:hypothetical protein